MRGLLDRLQDDASIASMTDLYTAPTADEQAALEALEAAYDARPDDLARLACCISGRSGCDATDSG